MRRSSLISSHVSPPSSLRKSPPSACSNRAYTRPEFALETASPIFPTTPDSGMPGFRVISVHVSPPSVLLNIPLPGPPEDIVYSLRKASHSAT